MASSGSGDPDYYHRELPDLREDQAAEECSICLEPLRVRVQANACTHQYHETCFDKMILARVTRCPLCRAGFAGNPPEPREMGLPLFEHVPDDEMFWDLMEPDQTQFHTNYSGWTIDGLQEMGEEATDGLFLQRRPTRQTPSMWRPIQDHTPRSYFAELLRDLMESDNSYLLADYDDDTTLAELVIFRESATSSGILPPNVTPLPPPTPPRRAGGFGPPQYTLRAITPAQISSHHVLEAQMTPLPDSDDF